MRCISSMGSILTLSRSFDLFCCECNGACAKVVHSPSSSQARAGNNVGDVGAQAESHCRHV